jgi:hypothetical protein
MEKGKRKSQKERSDLSDAQVVEESQGEGSSIVRV